MSDDIRIKLDWSEILVASSVGCMRNVQSLRNRCKPGNSIGLDDTWTINIEGAAGEMAVAKYLQMYWSGNVGNYNADDVGSYNIKTNTSRKFDDLILRPTDYDDKYYILVLSFLPEFVICGWIKGADGKSPSWAREGTPGRPAFFVPRSKLNPMATLPVEF